MAGRGGYDRGLSSDMSLVLRRGDRRKPLAVRPDGLAHMDDISHALDATPDAIMHVVLHSKKKEDCLKEITFVSSTRCPRRMASGSAPCEATRCG